MKTDNDTFQANLFYSYSHKDEKYRSNMETALSQIRRDKLLKEWSDHKIFPGQKISREIKEKMGKTDIFIFLLSPDFIESDACIEEWEYAKQLAEKGKPIFRIPIILRDCAWIDFLDDDDVKALVNDGKPVTNFDQEDTAWLQVYNGIKNIVDKLQKTFRRKSEFVKEMEETGFVSLEHVNLQDIFVFPTLSYYPPQAKHGLLRVKTIENQTELLIKKYVLIHGGEMSGKTTFGRHLFLSLSEDMATPVLHIDLKEVPKNPSKKVFREAYNRQFYGDYIFWEQQEGKILILDNLSPYPNSIKLIELAKEIFDKIFITLPSDDFYSFFRDETRLSDFQEARIETLNRRQQEELIRKRLELSDRSEPVTDGLVDQIEDRINSIIISQKIVPRYPFFVLSILQTYEGFMPDNLSITSYGHCYYTLIVASLIKAGISSEDSDINSCLNFAEQLAYKIYKNSINQVKTEIGFNEFAEEYKDKFQISDSILNRLKKNDYGIINEDAHFKTPYMYYFFLGKFLARGDEESKEIIDHMCENSHDYSNYITLLFIIHHTNDYSIIEDILVRTICALDSVQPAKLTQDETAIFKEFIDTIPNNILSCKSVGEERKLVREIQEINDSQVEIGHDREEQTLEDPVNDIYRILKNNKIMGQILRNKYGSLEKSKIKEILQTVVDSGLRLINLLLVDQNWIMQEINFLKKKYPDHDIEKMKISIQFLTFLWTMGNIEQIVSSINVPEIRDIVNEVVKANPAPAFDLIEYFYHLDSALELTEVEKQELETLLKKYDDDFLRTVLSIRTQHYMNTHHSKAPIGQSVCSLLKIKYTHKQSEEKHPPKRRRKRKRK